MLREIEFFHGVVFSRLIREIGAPLEITDIPNAGTSAYLLQKRLAVYIKYSTNRLSPWSFTFSPEHIQEIDHLKKAHTGFILSLVCHEDGIVALTADDVSLLLGDINAADRRLNISVHRRRRELYAVKGSMGKLDRKIGDNSLVKLVRDAMDPVLK